ncbi:hypothetical protein AVEN_25534-1 [Araneus ventricosus]|uniref:Tc1-like transposase DDE domain-containing protein n=1 Tax=Araneus ventricosus TaxID=182803 RepID=A0A4Y2QDT3_ARAVE|nr:hypothetical protein AVEN_25534-1 [Araneus ventricosus]
MLSRIENEHNFLNRVIFSDEATFHVGNKVSKHKCGIWAQKIPIQYRKWKETVQKSMGGVLLLHDTVIGPFFIAETSVTTNIYLDILQIYAIPQMQHLQSAVFFQHDAGARMFEQFAGTGLPAGYPQGF